MKSLNETHMDYVGQKADRRRSGLPEVKPEYRVTYRTVKTFGVKPGLIRTVHVRADSVTEALARFHATVKGSVIKLETVEKSGPVNTFSEVSF